MFPEWFVPGSTLGSRLTGTAISWGCAELETRWHLFNLLGLEKPQGFDGTLHLDEFTKRGPGAGVDMDYVREDYYGLFRGYFLHDDGKDKLGGHPDRGGTPDTTDRGRLLWRHRQFLPQSASPTAIRK